MWLHAVIMYVKITWREVGFMKMKRNDKMLIVITLVIAIIVFLIHNLLGGKGADTVTVKVDGKITGTYSLIENQTIEINDGSNILEIKDGIADMIEADCPDKLCVKQKAISKNGESIICLPNEVVVEVKSNEDSEYDAVVN